MSDVPQESGTDAPTGHADALTAIGADKALADQRDLDSLCGDRALETREVFVPNAFYGNDLVLKLYCGWPLDRTLKVIIPHGVVFNREYLWEAERRARLPVVLAYPDYRLATYRAHTRKIVLPGTAPFVFVCRMMRQPATQRSGTLFFPAHSTHGVNARTDHAAIAQRLTRLGSRCQPVRVCVYWRDYLAGRHVPYAAQGFEIVSAGHMYDPQFLFRLYHLLSMHRFAASHTTGSYIFQAVHAGCAYFHLDGFGVELEARSAANANDYCHPSEADPALAAFSTLQEEVTAQQWRVVESFFGSANVPSAAALRAILEMAERLDRYGIAYGREVGGLHFMLPAAPIRALRKAGRRLLSAGTRS
jgi:hypothetical protein